MRCTLSGARAARYPRPRVGAARSPPRAPAAAPTSSTLERDTRFELATPSLGMSGVRVQASALALLDAHVESATLPAPQGAAPADDTRGRNSMAVGANAAPPSPPNPRAKLVADLGDAVKAAALAGDLEAVRIAADALSRLVGAGMGNGAAVIDLTGERARRGEP